jgi:hypothetical protein
LAHFWHTPSGTHEGRAPTSATPGGVSFTPLQSVLPSIGITKRQLKHLAAIQLVRDQRDTGRQELAYSARPFVLCGLPLRKPAEKHLAYTRRNGRFSLTIVAHPQFGLPYGQDRLIPIWISTLALRQKSRLVRFPYLSDMLDYFELPKTGYYYARLAKAFQRLFAATIFFGTEAQQQQHAILDWVRFHFFDRVHLWYNREGVADSSTANNLENLITLSDAFYNEIQQHAIPIERRVVAALSNAPGALDLYTWLVWRTWRVNNGPTHIPLFGAQGLCQQLGTTEYSRERAYREKMSIWLTQVKLWWPKCPARLSDDGQFLVVHSAWQSRAVRSVERPVDR